MTNAEIKNSYCTLDFTTFTNEEFIADALCTGCQISFVTRPDKWYYCIDWEWSDCFQYRVVNYRGEAGGVGTQRVSAIAKVKYMI